jgi:hypothetical protein
MPPAPVSPLTLALSSRSVPAPSRVAYKKVRGKGEPVTS